MNMEQMLFLSDCYKKQFEATVEEVIPSDSTIEGVPSTQFIILNETAFYPLGGGQPGDTGLLIKEAEYHQADEDEEFKVIKTIKRDVKILDEVDVHGLEKGDLVKGRIDWPTRHVYMRYHTALHIISSVLWKDTQAQITGNNISYEKARIDFNLESFNRERFEEYIAEANKIIKENHPVEIRMVNRDTLEMQEDAVIKLAKSIPDSIQTIRLIDIKDVDIQPCAGCHVSNTKEIGSIEILKIENKGSNNRRVTIRLLNDFETPGALDEELDLF